MKLSSVAVLFGAAVAAFFPGASADSVSLRGTTPDEESFIDMINCSRKTTCEYAYGTCLRIDTQCQGFCVWVGSKQNGSCVRGSGGNRSCRSNINSSTCLIDGCVWSNNACRNPSTSTSFQCSDFDRTSNKNCMSKGCVWDGNTRTCNAKIITRSCRSLTIGSDCFSAGCDWRDGVCFNPSTSFQCSDYDRNTCVGNGCVWDGNTRTCNANIITRSCRSIRDSSTCRINDCFWDSITSTCNAKIITRSCRSISDSSTCSSNDCFWDSITSTCNAKIINRSNPTPSRSGDMDCTGPNSNQCDFMNEFCYTKGNCSANAPGMCQVKPKNYADCANSGKFNTYSTSAGYACGTTRKYESECAAAQEGKNIPFTNEDEVAEEVEREESDSVFEEE